MLSHYSNGEFRFLAEIINDEEIRFIKYPNGLFYIGSLGYRIAWTNTPYKIINGEDELMVELL